MPRVARRSLYGRDAPGASRQPRCCCLLRVRRFPVTQSQAPRAAAASRLAGDTPSLSFTLAAPALALAPQANRHVQDAKQVEKLVAAGEAKLKAMMHPDPYTIPTDPGGSK